MPTEKATRHDAHSLLTIAAGVILGFALNLITARALGPSGKGLLDLVGASSALFTLALGFSLNAGLTQYVAAKNYAPAGLVIKLWLWALLAGAGVATALTCAPVFARRLGLLPETDSFLWTVFIASSTTLGIAAASLRGIAIGRGGLITANRIDVGIKFALLAAYVCAILSLNRVNAVTLAIVALPVLAVLPLLLQRAQNGPVHADHNALRSIIAATMALHGANILHFLNQRADLFFVHACHGSAEVGIYALSVSLAQTILFLSSALAIPLLPQVAAAADAGQAAQAAIQACRRFVLLGGAGALFLGVVSPWIVPFVFGRDFADSLVPLLILLPGMIAFGLTNLLVSYFAGMRKNRINLRVALCGLVVTVAGNLTLTPSLGALGAAWVSTLSYGGMAFVSLWVFARSARCSIHTILMPDRETLSSCMRMLAQLRP